MASPNAKSRGLFSFGGPKDHWELYVNIIEASYLPSKDLNGYSDPFIRIKVGSHKAKGLVVEKNLHPVFNEEFLFKVQPEKNDELSIKIYDSDRFSKEMIARCKVKVADLLSKPENSWVGWFDLVHPSTLAPLRGSRLYMKLKLNKVSYSKQQRDAHLEDVRRSLKSLDLKDERDEKKDFGEHDSFTVFIGTWNVGNAPPPEDMSAWLKPNTGSETGRHRPYDIVVIGAQECDYKSKSSKTCDEDWLEKLAMNLPGYENLESNALMQIKLSIWVNKNSNLVKHSKLSAVQTTTEATGIAHALGNKGGVVALLRIDDLSLCFINSHLAAHQDKCTRRNSDVSEIISGSRIGEKAGNFDLLHQFHHVFWMGDLNYRVDWGPEPEATTPSKEVFDEMTGMISEKRYAELFAKDQLAREIKEKRVFVGFQDGTYNFPPTFKVLRQADIAYNEHRSPAWCDRILWKSLPGMRVRQMSFGCAIPIDTSDHKPVYGTYEVQMFNTPPAIDETLGDAKIIVTDLEATGAPVTDPTMSFYSPILIKALHAPIKNKETTVFKWEKKDVPEIPLQVNNKARLRLAYLQLRVTNGKMMAMESPCFAILPLADFVDAAGPQPFAVDVLKDGLSAGRISGKLQLEWSQKPKLSRCVSVS